MTIALIMQPTQDIEFTPRITLLRIFSTITFTYCSILSSRAKHKESLTIDQAHTSKNYIYRHVFFSNSTAIKI